MLTDKVTIEIYQGCVHMALDSDYSVFDYGKSQIRTNRNMVMADILVTVIIEMMKMDIDELMQSRLDLLNSIK